MSKFQQIVNTVSDLVESEEFEQFHVSASDFISARERGESAGTQITQMTVALEEAAEHVHRSFVRQEESGQYINVISPVVVPKGGRSYLWIIPAIFLVIVGLGGIVITSAVEIIPGVDTLSIALFGPHYWLLLIGFVAFKLWKNSFVMIPDGCQALITKFGKLETIVGPGRTWLFHPWKKVSYIVNTTKEYPYNAPIREAPTSGRVNASVDLFLQFKVENPSDFIFTLGGAQGFTEKLENAISEVTRALIYEQKAEEIYDLVGESTQSLLDTLNKQFLPAVRFVNANITHAEPANQQYRMDLASPEMVRVAKEAYTYEYELKLRKEQDEGDFNKDLATMRETLSDIRAVIARYQAQMDTAREKETNRANAYARRLMVEAESEAKANAALLEAQALDIRAMSAAYYPQILEYRFQQDVLEKVQSVADKLPRVVQMGDSHDAPIDFMTIAQQMMGIQDAKLYSEEDIQALRKRINEIAARVKERANHINKLVEKGQMTAGAGEEDADIPDATEIIPEQPQANQPQANQPQANQPNATEGGE